MSEYELYRKDSEAFCSVTVSACDREFRIQTHDMGPLVEEWWGDADYEVWTAVPHESWGDLLMALAKEFFEGDSNATRRLRDICRKHEVKHNFDQWA